MRKKFNQDKADYIHGFVVEESLYRTKKGKWFLVIQDDRYADWDEGQTIEPLTFDEAKAWAGRNDFYGNLKGRLREALEFRKKGDEWIRQFEQTLQEKKGGEERCQ